MTLVRDAPVTDHHQRLGITPNATPAELKAAYHAKLREFPAHSHPQEFKEIRAAYEALRKGEQSSTEDLFQIQPFQVELDATLLQQFRQRLASQVEVNLEEMIRLTF
jgi:DnaJ-class molecular chaperone